MARGKLCHLHANTKYVLFSQKSAEPDRRPRGTRYPTRRMLIDLGRKVRRFLAIRARKRRRGKKEREAINYGSKNEQPFKETSNGTKNSREIAIQKNGLLPSKSNLSLRCISFSVSSIKKIHSSGLLHMMLSASISVPFFLSPSVRWIPPQ